MSYPQFKGTGVALITPFKAGGVIDWEALERVILNQCVGELVGVAGALATGILICPGGPAASSGGMARQRR